jgi:hypothetical protein
LLHYSGDNSLFSRKNPLNISEHAAVIFSRGDIDAGKKHHSGTLDENCGIRITFLLLFADLCNTDTWLLPECSYINSPYRKSNKSGLPMWCFLFSALQEDLHAEDGVPCHIGDGDHSPLSSSRMG